MMEVTVLCISIVTICLEASLSHIVNKTEITRPSAYTSYSDNDIVNKYRENTERQAVPIVLLDGIQKPESDEKLEKGVNCTRERSTLTCQTIPAKIPQGITRVIVSAPGQPVHIAEHQFKDSSWTRIKALVIEGDDFNLDKNDQFTGLANLSSLYLNGSDIENFKRHCFAGLYNLQSLSLAGMDEMDGSSLQLALANESVLPKLKFFTISPGQTYRSSFMKIRSYFFTRLVSNQLQTINICNTIMEVKAQDLAKLIIGSRPSLNELNFTGSFLILDYSLSKYQIKQLQSASKKPFANVFDISHSRMVVIQSSSNRDQTNKKYNRSSKLGRHYISYLYLLVETLYADNLFKDHTEFRGVENYSSYKCFLKRLVFRGNYIAIFNLTLIFPPNNAIRNVNFSNNKMNYVGKGAFSTMFALEYLNLSNNRLFYMEKKPEFETIFETLKHLTILDMSSNNLSFIPSMMFLSNQQLASLILKSNRLTSLSFALGHLKKLRQLDLRDNQIKTLDAREMGSVQMIFQERLGQLDILFAGNPIECLCQNVHFISLLVKLRTVTNEHILCSYEGDIIDVNNNAVRKCNYLCKRVMIISLSVTCSLVCLVVIVTIVVKIKRVRERKKKKNVEWQLRENVRAGSFVCFTAVAGNDEAVVNAVLLRNLRRLLQAKVGIDKETVCTGNMFRPGFSICEEAYRLLKQCPVFVGVVSESFLGSQYCRLELQEACKQNKPAVLVFLGHVDTEEMPPYMQEVFRRNSRAWIKKNEQGYYYLVPNIRMLGEAIWDLAVAELLHW